MPNTFEPSLHPIYGDAPAHMTLADMPRGFQQTVLLTDVSADTDSSVTVMNARGIRLIVSLSVPAVVADLEIYRIDGAEDKQKLTGAGVDDDTVGTEVWATPGNITNDIDNLFASAQNTAAPATETTHYLSATGFDFGFLAGLLPGKTTVLGFEIEIDRKAVLGATGTVTDDTIQLQQSGAVIGTDQSVAALWPASEEVKLFGGSSNLMGTSGLTVADLNDPTFGVVVSVIMVTAVAEAVSVAQVDGIRLRPFIDARPLMKTFTNIGLFNRDGLFVGNAERVDLRGRDILVRAQNITGGDVSVSAVRQS